MLSNVKINFNQVLLHLSDVAAQLQDFRPFWMQLLNNNLREQIMNVFATNGYGRWPARRDNLPHPLLRKSYRYYNSLVQGTAETIIEATAYKFIYGSRTPYGYVHERGRGRVPQRAVLLPLAGNQTFNASVVSDANRYVQSIINRTDRR